MSETMGFSALPSHRSPHPRRFPPPHGLCRPAFRAPASWPPPRSVPSSRSPSTSLNARAATSLNARAASAIPVLPAPLPLPAVHAAPAVPATARLPPSQVPNASPTLTRLISRSTPYLTFLQHQHFLRVSPTPTPVPPPPHPCPAPTPGPSLSRLQHPPHPCPASSTRPASLRTRRLPPPTASRPPPAPAASPPRGPSVLSGAPGPCRLPPQCHIDAVLTTATPHRGGSWQLADNAGTG